jgi:hypothetical protein
MLNAWSRRTQACGGRATVARVSRVSRSLPARRIAKLVAGSPSLEELAVPLHVRLALALVAFAAAGSVLASIGMPFDGSSDAGGYAMAISAGSGVTLVGNAAGEAGFATGREVLACRSVLHLPAFAIGARCQPRSHGHPTLASGD